MLTCFFKVRCFKFSKVTSITLPPVADKLAISLHQFVLYFSIVEKMKNVFYTFFH